MGELQLICKQGNQYISLVTGIYVSVFYYYTNFIRKHICGIENRTRLYLSKLEITLYHVKKQESRIEQR